MQKDYEGSLTIDQLHKAHKSHIGGTLWHSFDHQRGYHPDPFYGGIMDVFRQPKYSYAMFTSQRDPALNCQLLKAVRLSISQMQCPHFLRKMLLCTQTVTV